MRIANEPVFSSGNMAITLTSSAFSISEIFGFAAQFTFTGSPAGALKIQVSCDPDSPLPMPVNLPTHWSDLTGTSTVISAAGDIVFNVDVAYYNWIRFVYTPTSGSGSLNGRLNIKGF